MGCIAIGKWMNEEYRNYVDDDDDNVTICVSNWRRTHILISKEVLYNADYANTRLCELPINRITATKGWFC
jgi:hypothetical protein